MKELHELTELQLHVLEVLWSSGEATATEVHAQLEPTLKLSRKTIGTLLHRLEKQAVVTHAAHGREYVYRARVSRDAVSASKLASVKARLFGGRTPEMIGFALSAADVQEGDVERIREMLRKWESR